MYIYICFSRIYGGQNLQTYPKGLLYSCSCVCALSVQICTVANRRMYVRMRKDVYNILQHISETCSWVWEQQSPTFFRMKEGIMVGRQWFSLGMTAVQLVISLGLPALRNLRCSQQLMTSSCWCNLCWLYDMNSWQSAHGGSHGPSGTSWKYLDLESLEVDTGRRT